MLRALRNQTKSIFFKCFLVLLICGFALWGVGDLTGGAGEKKVLTLLMGNTFYKQIKNEEALNKQCPICLLEFSNKNDIEIVFKQTNHEGELIELIHEAGKIGDGVIINPAGYSHTSIALYDALLSLHIPIIEVHISNIYKREEFRHKSLISKIANGFWD